MYQLMYFYYLKYLVKIQYIILNYNLYSILLNIFYFHVHNDDDSFDAQLNSRDGFFTPVPLSVTLK